MRYSVATDRLRATGHTASDQVETVLYRLVASGNAKGIKPKREDGVVRPLLTLWREETEAYCRAEGLEFRTRQLERGHAPRADPRRAAAAAAASPPGRRAEPAARSPSSARRGSTSCSPRPRARAAIDLGQGLTAVREYDRVWLEQTPVALEGRVRWGPWTIESELAGLKVRSWRPGDRLAGRRKKVQDVFVDAKIPRSEREAWPLVVRGREVVAVPGLVEAPGVKAERA